MLLTRDQPRLRDSAYRGLQAGGRAAQPDSSRGATEEEPPGPGRPAPAPAPSPKPAPSPASPPRAEPAPAGGRQPRAAGLPRPRRRLSHRHRRPRSAALGRGPARARPAVVVAPHGGLQRGAGRVACLKECLTPSGQTLSWLLPPTPPPLILEFCVKRCR